MSSELPEETRGAIEALISGMSLPDGLTTHQLKLSIEYLLSQGVSCSIEGEEDWGGYMFDANVLMGLLADRDAFMAVQFGVSKQQWQAYVAAGYPNVIPCSATTASGRPCSLPAIDRAPARSWVHRWVRAPTLDLRCHVHQRTGEAAYRRCRD